MAENTNISWCDRTWSPWFGCTQVSMGPQGACEGCYARHMSETRFGRVVFGGPGRGEGTRDVRADSAWKEPLKWEREAAAAVQAWRTNPFAMPETPKPSTFVFPSMCDPFDNHPDLREPRRRFFRLIRATPHLKWLLLTKRPGNIVKLFLEATTEAAPFFDPATYWPRNAAIGCTVVSQEEADRDIPKLLAAKAALNPAFAFLSMEPLLGPVDLTAHLWGRAKPCAECPGDADCGCGWYPRGAVPDEPALDWIITGGETDQGAHKARPAHIEWVRSLRDQCAAAGTAFHLKQWGENVPVEEVRLMPGGQGPGFGRFDHCAYDMASETIRIGKAHDPCTLDGVRHDARPEIKA